mgnify:CR=1 FL=1
MAISNRELPHDLIAEKSLLGCLLVDSHAFDEISDLSLMKEDFHHPRYGIIFDCVKDLASLNQPIDFVTVCSKLTARGKLDEVGGKEFVATLAEDQASSANIYHYAKIVKGKSSMRTLIRTAMTVVDTGMSHTGEVDTFIQDVEASFFKLTNEAKSGRMTTLNQSLKEVIKDMQNPARKPGEIGGLPSGYHKLDEYLLGLQPGQMIVIAGRPGSGKTALGINMAVNACLETKLPIAIFSLEMQAKELSIRILSYRARVENRKFKMKTFDAMDMQNIARAMNELSEMPIQINDSGAVTLPDIQSQCRKIKAERGLGMIVIDYLQLMKSHTKTPSREQQIAEISRGVKMMAKELECPVIILSQLNREAEKDGKRPSTSQLRESGAIEQDADVIMLVYREDLNNFDNKTNIAEVIIGKNRAGSQGVVQLAWKGEYTSFEPLSKMDGPPAPQAQQKR